MTRSKTILLTAFVLVLSAGVVVGRLWTQLPAMEAPHPAAGGPPPSWLADQLDLRAEQRRQMDAIWADTKQQIDKAFERRQQLDRERDQAIQELLTPAEWQAYGKIMEDFHNRRMEFDKQRRQLIHDANERSQALLDDGQKKKWEALRNAHDHAWHGPRGQENQRPATMPAGGGT